MSRSPRHIGSTEGCAVALDFSVALTDAEFRLLVLLAERPDGPSFRAELGYFVSKGMDMKSADRAAKSLHDMNSLCCSVADTQFFYRHGVVEWRFY